MSPGKEKKVEGNRREQIPWEHASPIAPRDTFGVSHLQTVLAKGGAGVEPDVEEEKQIQPIDQDTAPHSHTPHKCHLEGDDQTRHNHQDSDEEVPTSTERGLLRDHPFLRLGGVR